MLSHLEFNNCHCLIDEVELASWDKRVEEVRYLSKPALSMVLGSDGGMGEHFSNEIIMTLAPVLNTVY